jgi:hypothetical protein
VKYSNKQEHRATSGRRSNRVSVNPYFVEDVAMTLGELARARANDGAR